MTDSNSNVIPSNPDTLLTRRELAKALRAKGFKIAPSTLATKASRGLDAPPFRKFGRIPLYQWGESLAWAQGRLGPPRRSTSEPDAPQVAA